MQVMSEPTPRDDTASRPSRRAVAALAVAALVLAIVAVGLSAVAFMRPSPAGCQAAAWNAVPIAGEIPAGWTVSATDIYPNSQTTTIHGPIPADGSAASTVYLSVTCYGDRAADALSRSQQASMEAGRSVTTLEGMGDAGYTVAAVRPARAPSSSGAARWSRCSAGRASSRMPSCARSARRRTRRCDARSGTAGQRRPPSRAPLQPPSASPSGLPIPPASASPEPSQAAASPAAPELEAHMPRTVAGTTLSVQSATGDQVLGKDAASKALISTLASFGKKPADLQVAQAYDPAGAVDITVLGFRVPGITGAKLLPAVLRTWLFAGATGVTTKVTTVSGVAVTQVSYSGDTSVSYVLAARRCGAGDPVRQRGAGDSRGGSPAMTSDATGLPLAEPAADRIVVSWDELDALVAALAEHVGRDYDLVLAITRGGLVPAGILAYRLDLREILVAGVEFYTTGGATHEAPRFGHFPDAGLLAGRRILVVDEVWETGETMAAVLARVRDAGGHPVSAVIHYKPGRSRVAEEPDHHAALAHGWVTYPYKVGD